MRFLAKNARNKWDSEPRNKLLRPFIRLNIKDLGDIFNYPQGNPLLLGR